MTSVAYEAYLQSDQHTYDQEDGQEYTIEDLVNYVEYLQNILDDNQVKYKKRTREEWMPGWY